MGYAELIERLQTLPQDKQAEVFDFVEFLFVRSGAGKNTDLSHEEWSSAEFSQMAMTQAMRGLEDDRIVYTSADLRERWL